ncbi:MAG: hypothetical protein NTV51_14010 [Verrucomicrobia bacterium]|nr:hypothetical protein [Verrucomicrobiota bacterium]
MQLVISDPHFPGYAARPTWTRFFATLALGAGCLVGAATLAAQPAHLTKGHRLVDDITAAQSQGAYTGVVDGATVFLNRYGGSWDTPGDLSFIRFFDASRDANTGPYAANYTTCAPLVTHLLKNAYGWDWKQHLIPDTLDNDTPVAKASPKSYLYVSAIKHQVGFASQITNLLDVQPGDIAARWEVGTDEGHTMIVVGVNTATTKAYPVSSTDANFEPALAGSTYYEVTVLDSSSSGHSSDTRMITYGGKTDLSGGVGRGIIGVFVNASGAIIAHTWSLPTSNYLTTKNGVTSVNPSWLSGIKTRLKKQADFELVIGRLPVLAPAGS